MSWAGHVLKRNVYMILTGKLENVEDLGLYKVEEVIIIIIWNFKKRAGGFRLDYSSSGRYK
jgi:hypothetical protein